jgi:ribonuclease PH
MVKFGDTHVLVTATLEERLPPWLKGQGRGWVTAEYGMLPRATLERTRREASAGKQNGRTVEIQRLIGRSAARGGRSQGARRAPDHHRLRCDPGRRRHPHRLDHRRLGRALRLHRLDEDPQHGQGQRAARQCRRDLLRHYQGTPVLDLDYAEDSQADTDANFVLTGDGNIVEVQGTAEKTPFSQDEFTHAAGAGAAGGKNGREPSWSTCRKWR